uniref:Uncharacterized protein n=1 Tax=Anguilla anguilla TaxID=7936 RepID=A0A0E9PCG2_ANGAN
MKCDSHDLHGSLLNMYIYKILTVAGFKGGVVKYHFHKFCLFIFDYL